MRLFLLLERTAFYSFSVSIKSWKACHGTGLRADPSCRIRVAQLFLSSHCYLTASWARAYTSTREGPLGAGESFGRHVARGGRTMTTEKLWREFFSDPSQWWDHRTEKANLRYPDFKHKKTQQSLWVRNNLNPPWVETELAAMAPGIVQLNSFSWNMKLRRYVKAGDYMKTLKLFRQMQSEGMVLDTFTFVPVLNACSSLRFLDEGRRVHKQIIERGYECDIFVANSLIDMYAKCGNIEDAYRVFDKMPLRDVVSWNAMILGFVKSGEAEEALELYRQMYRENVEPDPTTFVGVLNACASVAALGLGWLIHEQISRRGYDSDVFVANSLVDMYAKCGSIEDAQRVFHKMPSRTVVTWTAMILAYVKSGEGQKALEFYRQMQQEGLEPNSVTFVIVLNACATVAALGKGRHVHKQIIERGYESDACVGSSLVDMYAKCGSIEDARRVLDEMPSRDVVSWTAMLAGYAMHGRAKEAIEHFERMRQEDVKVNVVTFVSLLSACSHGGLAEEGLSYFQSMSEVYNISPTKEHYACLVDLLGRAGHLHRAEDLISSMPCKPDATVWTAFLGACRIHGNVEMGERVAKRVLQLEPEDASGYVMLSNIYYAAGRRDNAVILQEQRLGKGMNHEPGRTWIEVNNELHSFVVNDKGHHPRIEEIHAELERLARKMKNAGYVRDVRFVSHDGVDNLKEVDFCHHSQKLAIAFAEGSGVTQHELIAKIVGE